MLIPALRGAINPGPLNVEFWVAEWVAEPGTNRDVSWQGQNVLLFEMVKADAKKPDATKVA